MGRACGMYGKGRSSYRVLVGKPKRKDYLENSGIDENNQITRKGIEQESVDWINQAVVNTVMNIHAPQSGGSLTS